MTHPNDNFLVGNELFQVQKSINVAIFILIISFLVIFSLTKIVSDSSSLLK